MENRDKEKTNMQSDSAERTVPSPTASSWLQVVDSRRERKRGSGSSQQSPHSKVVALNAVARSSGWMLFLSHTLSMLYSHATSGNDRGKSTIPRSNYLDLVIAKGENGRSADRAVEFPTVYSRVISANGPAEPVERFK